MGVLLGYNDVKKQSQAVWGQFGESKWLPFSKENAKLEQRPAHELRLNGMGKFCVLAAMGESLQDAIPTLKKYRDRFDLVTCDKGFGVLLEQGIKADFVQLADCNIPFDKWLKPYVKETEGVKLLATCYANTEWTTAWKGPRYFYVNRDAIDSQNKFIPIMPKGLRTIPAGSNVSNAMVIFQLGIDEFSQANWAGYEEYLLVGYDYSWRTRSPETSQDVKQGNYYAFNDTYPKRAYMQHRTLLDINGEIAHTSENLMFSAKWLYSYVTAYNLPVTNCSGRGILDIPNRGKLDLAVSRISSNKERIARVRDNFAMMTKAQELVEMNRVSFDNSRRMLWQ